MCPAAPSFADDDALANDARDAAMTAETNPSPNSAPDKPWQVADASNAVSTFIKKWGMLWVEGEITQWSVSGGNVYGKLKDLKLDATLSFNVWRGVRSQLPATLKQGDHVVALVKFDFYVKGGTLSAIVQRMRHVGIGDLLERLERLRAALRAEGLFDERRKKRLPFLPACIGLITGKDSDAEKDVLRNAALRWPGARFRVVHANVQGDRTVDTVLAALTELDRDPEVDVIIIARGGGDFQNLLGFSDERLVRAVAAARTPVVSAIGHENDRPILDDVADLRASTPTDAAKRIVPDVSEELARVDDARHRLRQRVLGLIRGEESRLELLRTRPVLRRPEVIVDERSMEITRARQRARDLVEVTLERAEARVHRLRAQVVALSPQHTLERGYAIVQRADGRVVTGFDEAPAGRRVMLRLARGSVEAESIAAHDDQFAEPTG